MLAAIETPTNNANAWAIATATRPAGSSAASAVSLPFSNGLIKHVVMKGPMHREFVLAPTIVRGVPEDSNARDEAEKRALRPLQYVWYLNWLAALNGPHENSGNKVVTMTANNDCSLKKKREEAATRAKQEISDYTLRPPLSSSSSPLRPPPTPSTMISAFITTPSYAPIFLSSEPPPSKTKSLMFVKALSLKIDMLYALEFLGVYQIQGLVVAEGVVGARDGCGGTGWCSGGGIRWW
ncbi:hypothetical protein LXL04_029766 [Taraxacum kok-saghyz]